MSGNITPYMGLLSSRLRCHKETTQTETEANVVPGATPGQLSALTIQLGNLATVGPCVADFLARESRLDVLFNNADVSHQPPGSVTAQGHEVHMGTNCLGPYLLTKLRLPIPADMSTFLAC